jgi:CBS domain containing-hemolysin-like protein
MLSTTIDVRNAHCAPAPGRLEPMTPRASARRSLARWGAALGASLLCTSARASLFQGDALDAVANVIAWVALVVGPIVVIAVFWLVHILPERIAEKRKHPQAKAIQTLCLLSLFFGGLLWPIAWLWAYTKPVLHKMAYGTDVEDEEHPVRTTEASAADGVPDAARARMKVVDGNEGMPSENPAGREHA